MTSFGKCKLCGEKISYSPNNIHFYGAHLIERHPEVDFAHFALIYEPAQDTSGCSCPVDTWQQNKETLRRSKPGKTSLKYKTTIQSWKCAPIPLHCPRCGKTNTPIIKRQRHKLTRSSSIACLLLGCWPFCFLPFIISGSDLFYLYCKDCGYYIGMYDRRVSAGDSGVPSCRIPAVENEGQVCGCH